MNLTNSVSIVINSLRGGGAEKISTILANKFSEKEYKVNFVVLNLNNAIYNKQLNKNIRLVNLKVNHARYSIYRLYKYIKEYRPEKILVFNHEIAVALVIIRYLLKTDFRIISRSISTLTEKTKNEKSIWHKYFKTFFIKLLYKKVNRIVAQSKMMKTDLVKNFEITENKISIINNPIKIDVNNDVEKFSNNKNEILYVGRLEPEKGLKYLINAFHLILENKSDVKLRLVGQGSQKKDLEDYCHKLNISSHVIFNGFDKDIIKYYHGAKITVLTSLYEGFPNVLIESIACGTPVVAFDCPSGPGEIIEDGINGYLVKYLDINDLKEKMMMALTKNWDVLSLKKSVEKYHLDNIFPQYERILTF